MFSGGAVSESALKSYLLRVRDAFLASDAQALKSIFLMPLVVYSAAGVLLIKDEEAFRIHMMRYLEALKAAGVKSSDCQIIETDAVSNGRFRTSVRWTDFSSSGEPVALSLIRYFLVEDCAETWKIEMMEFVELPISISEAERIIH